jgi:signal transduction histidine kinase
VGARLEVEASGLVVDADPERLAQAIGNLVDNALLYGGRSILLRAQRKDGTVELHVADDGRGFDDAFLSRAFDRFSRADDARSNGGSGLGLSIVALIGAAHGGSASVANAPGGGADAWISVPSALEPALI